MTAPRLTPIHGSITSPVLVLGAERRLVLISGIVAAVLILSLARPLFALVGIGFWIVTLAALRRGAGVDPELSHVYLRHRRYRAYYAAQSNCCARQPVVREQLPC